jgi:hypothetical protein
MFVCSVARTTSFAATPRAASCAARARMRPPRKSVPPIWK